MRRDPPSDPIVWLDQIDETLRQSGIAEPNMDLARGAVLRTVSAELDPPRSRIERVRTELPPYAVGGRTIGSPPKKGRRLSTYWYCKHGPRGARGIVFAVWKWRLNSPRG